MTGRWTVVVLLSLLLAPAPAASAGQPAEELTADERFHRDATRALAHGDREAAAELAAGRDPSDPAAAALLARLLIDVGDYGQAEALLDPVAEANPGSVAGLEFARLLLGLGRAGEAVPFLEAVIVNGLNSFDGLSQYYGALASRAAGGFRRANTFLRGAARALPDDPAIHTAWGELFLEKYNNPDALQSFQDALELDEEWVPALVGMARVLANENPPVARGAVERALGIDESSVGAHLFVAELELGDRNRDAARESIDRALAVNPRSLEARSLLAAIAWLEDRSDDFAAEVDRVLEINPAYGDVYRIAGSQTARAYRFPEAVDLVRRALELDPDNTRAYAELGMHLLRTGDEPAARVALERSFEDDPYDVVTFNLLQMMDNLDEFETIESGDLVVRLHPDEAPVLREYVVDIAQEALDELSARYEMTVQTPVLVEVFPNHDDFAVRTLGLPGMLGALGACFGQVVTLDSPRARPPGDFNWMSTLWHEIAHVITLQMSKQRLPRWLSEGISTYEEKRKHPAWGRDQVLEFANALNGGTLLSLSEIERGFTRPESISLSYFHASIVVEHLIDAYGMEALRTLIRAYGDGLETEEALARIDLDYERLQASFDAAVEEQFGALRRSLENAPRNLPEGPERVAALRELAEEQPDNFNVQFGLGQALREAGDTAAARAAFERAAALAPMATGLGSPRGQLASLAEAEGDAERAMVELERLLEYDETSIDAVRRFAALAERAGDDGRLQAAYERLIEIDPFDPVPHQTLGRIAKEAGRTEEAVRELEVALALGPVDRVAAHADLAETLFAAGRLAEARRQTLAALEIAPTYDRALELLLTIVEADR
ncbi:MAG: tetratricopeptide repeat protein [Acidobacteria bacterium]|nr:tetratricopeptide repeat protein [Acidobacteriota bacterium]MYH30333.1 tetratricopeptide repeat protein [Acidobacteriota bacterium]